MNRLSLKTVCVSLAIGWLLHGCAVGPSFKAPETPVPSGWSGTTNQAAPPPAELAAWWRVFEDAQLSWAVEQSLLTNLDLQIAQTRVLQARAARSVAVGGLLPAVDASGNYRRFRAGNIPGGAEPHAQDLFTAGLDAIWELDMFGGHRRNVESASATLLAGQESVRDAQVTLAAEVALTYVQLRGLQQQLAIAQTNLLIQRHTAGITRQRQAAGFVSALDTANAEAQLATTESVVPLLESAARQTIYALSVLLARSPMELLDDFSKPGPLPATPEEIPVGIPSDLLRRRPDLRRAEAQLHAATAQIGVATADLFPKFSLTGSIDYQSNLLRSWFTDPSRSWFFGPAVTWPIFRGGAIRANIRVQQALRDESFLAYQKAVLLALQDVENALVAFAKEREHHQSLARAVASNRRAVDLSIQLYTEGQTDFLNVLNAQRSLFLSEDALVLSERNLAVELIALYKALGGGWETAEDANTEATAKGP